MKQCSRHSPRQLLILLLSIIAGFSTASLQAASSVEAATEKITSALEGNFYEIEFFVFERNAVMEFNTREVLVGRKPLFYPASMMALNSPDEPVGSHYQIDPLTRLCMTYPTIVYTTTDPFAPEQEAETVDGAGIDDTTAVDEIADSVPVTPPQITPEVAVDPERELHEAIASFEEQLYASSNSWMSPDTFLLTSEASRVERRADARVLFHGRWVQPVPAREDPLPVLILAGETVGTGRELMGSVGVTLGRYLHFQADLNYTAPALGEFPLEVAVTASGDMMDVPRAAAAGGFMKLSQSRRMRSGELHYLDHPKLGILVRIDPVTVPQTLVDLALALEESNQ
jgi:hypothetical protein